MSAPRHLVVMAAGTGGHVIPGLAIAREMLARGWTVSWLGTTAGLENRLVPPAGLPMDTIGFSGLRGKGVWHAATGGMRLLGAFWSCLRILRRRRPAVVLGMGGYVCFPGGMMAALLGRPLALVNADATLLMSNRWLLPVADAITFGFDGEGAKLDKGVVTGNPVRAEIEAIPAPAERYAGRTGPLRLLIVGGSLGARVLNDTVPQALAEMAPGARPTVVHQCGAAQVEAAREAYARAGIGADVRPFIDDMAGELASADVVVCRAGAITVTELCVAGVPAVLVPLVVSTTHHQRDNADWMSGQGAAIHLPQGELTPRRLAEILSGLTRDTLVQVAARARALARPKATARIADLVERMAAA